MDGWERDGVTPPCDCDDDRADRAGSWGSGFEGAGKGLDALGTCEVVDVFDEDLLWVYPEPIDTLVPGCG